MPSLHSLPQSLKKIFKKIYLHRYCGTWVRQILADAKDVQEVAKVFPEWE
jgi:hypothetical protein